MAALLMMERCSRFRSGLIAFFLATFTISMLLVVIGSAEVQRSTILPIRFRNVAKEAGIDFVLENSATPEKQLIETMPGGAAAFDYDGDGFIDIFFTNG